MREKGFKAITALVKPMPKAIEKKPVEKHPLHYRPGCKECNIVIQSDRAFNAACSPKEVPLVIDKGKGAFLWDVDGTKYLDFASLIAVSNVGHSNPYVTKAISAQLKKITHTAGNDFYSPPMSFFIQRLVQETPWLHKAFLGNSGTEAIEAAMKLTRYYTRRTRFVAFDGCFHGRTFGSLSMTSSKAVHREGFAPFLPQVSHFPFPNPYRIEKEDPTSYVLGIMEHAFKTTVPASEIAAVFSEPIQGEGGYIVPPDNFFKGLKKLLDEHNILFVVDEVQSGAARTGRFWAIEHFGVKPEVLACAKGIGGGMPIGAIIFDKRLDTWPPGSHSNTFGGHALSCVAGSAALDYIKDFKLAENAERQGKYLMKRLHQLKDDSEFLGDVRGKGLMIGLEFVKDKHSKEPNPKARARFFEGCFDDQLIVLSAGESSVRLAPPLVINKQQCDTALRVVEENLKKLGSA